MAFGNPGLRAGAPPVPLGTGLCGENGLLWQRPAAMGQRGRAQHSTERGVGRVNLM